MDANLLKRCKSLKELASSLGKRLHPYHINLDATF